MPVRLGEPEARQAGQHPALVGDLGRQDDVEGRQAVRRDEQQPVLAERVQVAHLAAADERAGDWAAGDMDLCLQAVESGDDRGDVAEERGVVEARVEVGRG